MSDLIQRLNRQRAELRRAAGVDGPASASAHVAWRKPESGPWSELV